jgi:chitinase
MCIDAGTKELISFDTANIVKAKANFIKYKSLGGAMYWELSSDRNYNSGSLVQAVNSVFGSASNLDQTENHLWYPGSQFANMRGCMGGCPASVIPSPCHGLSAWSSKTAYTSGKDVTYGEDLLLV